jgi:hypothetical protein
VQDYGMAIVKLLTESCEKSVNFEDAFSEKGLLHHLVGFLEVENCEKLLTISRRLHPHFERKMWTHLCIVVDDWDPPRVKMLTGWESDHRGCWTHGRLLEDICTAKDYSSTETLKLDIDFCSESIASLGRVQLLPNVKRFGVHVLRIYSDEADWASFLISSFVVK